MKLYVAIRILCCIIFVLLLNCNLYKNPDYYSKYRMSDDLGQYSRALEDLVALMTNDKSFGIRAAAAEEIGNYSYNRTKGSHELLKGIGMPALVEAMKKERDEVVKVNILRAIGKIGPGNEVEIPIYITALDNGHRLEKYEAIELLKGIEYDLTSYVPVMVNKLNSEIITEKKFAISALIRMGRYAYDALEKLTYIRDNDKDMQIVNLASIAVKEIKDDYEEYIEKNPGKDAVIEGNGY